MAECNLSFDEGSEKGALIGMGDLAGYLKAEKACLKEIASYQSDQPTQTDLQRSLVRSRVESAFRKVRKHQLEQEIRFVEQNVLVKNTVVYDATSSSTIHPAEDKQQV